MKLLIYICCGLLFMSSFASCKKFLDKKPSQLQRVPSSLEDFQAVLDNTTVNNGTAAFATLVDDDYYLTTTGFNGLLQEIRKTYTWDKDALIMIENGSWNRPYEAVYHANFVLDGLKKLTAAPASLEKYNSIKGSALFFRALSFHSLAQLYCKPYSSAAAADLGIVLRTTSDISEPVVRATVQQTYDRIIADLNEAITLLPLSVPFNTMPVKAAAHGLLARVYLSMRDYVKAGSQADLALSYNSKLLNYNTLSSLPVNPISNPEILAISTNSPGSILSGRLAIVDSSLYRSYDVNDLRKTFFYGLNGANPFWKGSYNGLSDWSVFDGVAIDELYLIRAETYARAGNLSAAMLDLNELLRHRYKTGTFTDLTAASAAEALEKVLRERRKELAFRGLRWSDLRRFNLEGAAITLKRFVNNTEYTLPPHDLRWVLLIPDVEIRRSGIPQNPR